MSSRIQIITRVLGGLLLIGFLCWAGEAAASPRPVPEPQSTPGDWRSAPPPTVYPPSQKDNGAQLYWGMCQDCHGDQGQGLTAEWRAAFAPAYQNCWDTSCHGDHPAPNSFQIPAAGAPALAGPGALPQYTTAYQLGRYIDQNMPFFPAGSLSEDQAWELTAFLLAGTEAGSPQISLNATNSAAVPVHRRIRFPENPLPWVLVASILLVGGAAGYQRITAERKPASRQGNFFHHLHPATIPAEQSRLGYTLGAGGLAVFFCLVLLVTGALEMYYYQPSPDTAASSIQTLNTLVPYGSVVRNLHFWSAQLLVVALMIHLVRIILTGAYSPPRRFNYLLGLSLLVVALLLDFTGYLLRWDEGIRWALVVGTNLLKSIPLLGNSLYRLVIGGPEPGPASLIRFYSWHIFGLTLIFAAAAVWHIFRVRRDGGISAPPPGHREVQPRIPRSGLVRREVLAMLIAGSALLLISALIPAPIDQPLAAGGNLAGDSGAPWFFLWIQETLKLGNPFLWGVGLPLLAVVVLGLLPYLLPPARPEELGSWLPAGSRAAQITGMVIIVVIFLLTLKGWLS